MLLLARTPASSRELGLEERKEYLCLVNFAQRLPWNLPTPSLAPFGPQKTRKVKRGIQKANQEMVLQNESFEVGVKGIIRAVPNGGWHKVFRFLKGKPERGRRIKMN